MISREDFEIEIGHDGAGTYVRVVHRPTGNSRIAVEVDEVGRTRDALVAELRGVFYRSEDFRIDLACGPDSSWYRVTHLPTGVTRETENVGEHEIIEGLVDQVLEEIHASGELVEDEGDLDHCEEPTALQGQQRSGWHFDGTSVACCQRSGSFAL